MSELAPVVIFAYRRPEHLRRTLASLLRCEGYADSPVIVYRDGPRSEDEAKAVAATGEVAQAMLGNHAEYHYSETNKGLARSIIAGVSETVARYGRAIVVEDDLELAPGFLTFMNRALDHYAEDERVYQVSGYMFDVPELRNSSSAIFLPFTVSWGWATWKRAWDQFDPMATGWETLKTDRDLRRRFNLDGVYDYATMLHRQMTGKLDSWAIRWYWTVFKANGLVLFPPASMVRNMGFDGTGTHGRGLLRRFAASPLPAAEAPAGIYLPNRVAINAGQCARTIKALRSQNGGWPASVADCIRRLFNT